MMCALFVIPLLMPAPTMAANIGLTLTSDEDPLSIPSREQITFTVGITPAEVIAGHTLEIRFDDTELSFLSASQLVPFFGGAFSITNNQVSAAVGGIDIYQLSQVTSESIGPVCYRSPVV